MFRVTIWCHGVDYQAELEKLDQLAKKLVDQKDIIDNVDSWTGHFIAYLGKINFDPRRSNNSAVFKEKLNQFLFSPRGSKYRQQFTFAREPVCGDQAPEVLLSDITFNHRVFLKGPSEQIPAMNRVKKIIKESNLTGKLTASLPLPGSH